MRALAGTLLVTLAVSAHAAEPPAAPAELTAATKLLKGSWSCSGTMRDLTLAQRPVSVTLSWKVDMDGFWLVGSFSQKKSRDWPAPFRLSLARTYDASSKQWYQSGYDNAGGHFTEVGTPSATGITWEGDMMMSGMKLGLRESEKLEGKTLVLTGEYKGPDGAWQEVYAMRCKK